MVLKPKSDAHASQALSNNEAVVLLDTELTPELEQEGIARRKAREEREKQMFFKLVKQVPLWRSTQCRAVDAPQPRHVTFAPSISACR